MIVGVCAFSFASGSLASIMQNKDSQEAYMQGKVNRLNQIYKDYKLKLDLYSKLKLSLAVNNSNHEDDLKQFLDELPHNLKIETSLFVHKDVYRSIDFLKERSSLFICWICPLFKPSLVLQNQHIYFEQDEIHNIYFLKKGGSSFVLPNYQSVRYIDIVVGSQFGIIDIIGSLLQDEEDNLDKLNDWIVHKHLLKRQFTTMATEDSQLLSLSLHDLNRMKHEFLEPYENLFNEAFDKLYKVLNKRLKSIRQCEKLIKEMLILDPDQYLDTELDYGIQIENLDDLESMSHESFKSDSSSEEELLNENPKEQINEHQKEGYESSHSSDHSNYDDQITRRKTVFKFNEGNQEMKKESLNLMRNFKRC